MTKLTNQQIIEAGLADWVKLARRLHARFRTGDFAHGAAFVAEITDAAEAANHHPDVKLTYPLVDITLMSHEQGGVTERDVALARQISQLAASHGFAAAPREVQEIELALDAADFERIRPFWAVVLTGDAGNVTGEVDVVDPTERVPLLWLQRTDEHPTPRQRFHLDVWIHPDVLEDRIAAAVAAGGRIVDASEKPSFVVLADTDGNRVCLCTTLDR